MKREKFVAVFFAAVIVLGLAASAGAVDGTIEINQAIVNAAGGCPYTIANAGTYRLTGNLSCSSGKSGILVNTGAVTIDLNGFQILGSGSAGTFGISVPNAGVGVTLVENGTVEGFGTGISLQGNSAVKNVRALFNTNAGIAMASDGLIEGCIASANNPTTGVGISCGAGCNIWGNTASNNNVGIASGGASLILRNTLESNNATALSITGAANATTGYGENVLSFNATNVSGGTSMKNNVCSGVLC
jgi:hypothetical protein